MCNVFAQNNHHTSMSAPIAIQEVHPDAASADGIKVEGVQGTASPSTTTASEKWKQAGKAIKVGLAMSSGFQTLRDRYGVNEIELSELKTVKRLGEGAFATVEQALYTPAAGGAAMQVAVKKLKPEVVSKEEDLNSFMSEVSLMRKLKHKHIVEYIGIGATNKSSEAMRRSSMFLVTELMEGGTLKKLLMKQMAQPHSSLYGNQDAIRWCIHIADALAYIHGAKPMIIHRDLKLENILLKGTNVTVQEAKLADFGLVAFVQKKAGGAQAKPAAAAPVPIPANVDEHWTEKSKEFLRRLDTMATKDSLADSANEKEELPVNRPMALPSKALEQLTGSTGTLMYMAPEMFHNREYNEKIDVFSFAVIMYELLHKYMMIFAVSNQGTPEEIEAYAGKVAGGWRPPLSDKFPPQVLDIIRDAWAQDPASRPSMAQIRDRLKKVLEDKVFGEPKAAGGGGAGASQGCGCVVS